MGTVIDTYSGYRDVNSIGSGGFGNVYQYKDQTAVKEEFKVLMLYMLLYYVHINGKLPLATTN